VNPEGNLSLSPGRNGPVEAGRGASSPWSYPQYPERFIAVIKDGEGMAEDSPFPDLFEIEYLLFEGHLRSSSSLGQAMAAKGKQKDAHDPNKPALSHGFASAARVSLDAADKILAILVPVSPFALKEAIGFFIAPGLSARRSRCRDLPRCRNQT
jgi:hypothetical protein